MKGILPNQHPFGKKMYFLLKLKKKNNFIKHFVTYYFFQTWLVCHLYLLFLYYDHP